MIPQTFVILVILILADQTLGHGMMLDPLNRSSVWRFNSTAPVNYDDNQNFCGGFWIQWGKFGGKCGLCGDAYSDPHPQDNENTGKYGQGMIVREYQVGSIIDVQILLTANHRGNFKYSLCVLKDLNSPEPDEECFIPLALADGSPKYIVSGTDYAVFNKVQLPNKVICDICVLRWHYTAGNNWGHCGDGTSRTGCGPQETFRSCADIRIL